MKLIYDGVSYKGELDCISDFTNKSKFRILMAGSVTPAKNQMDIICAGEEFHAAMKRSTNGGGENSPMLAGEDDFYELFMANLK